jgi:site-specific recombinase XerD
MSRRIIQGKRFGEVNWSFGTAGRKSGIEGFSFHGLSHNFPSNLTPEGADLITARDLMGRKTLDMTLRYSHLAPNQRM